MSVAEKDRTEREVDTLQLESSIMSTRTNTLSRDKDRVVLDGVSVRDCVGLLLGALFIAAAGTPVSSQERIYDYHSSSAEIVWRGTQALKLCNGLFVSNRTVRQIYDKELTGLRPRGPMTRSRVAIDYREKAVAVGVGGADPVPPMRSAHREGLGCVVMAPHQTFDDIDDLPILQMTPFAGDPDTIPWPDGDMVDATSLSSDIDGDALEAAGEWAFDRVTHGGHQGQITTSLLVVHEGDIIYERYAPGFDRDTRTRTWSTAKSLASTIIGIAVDQGLLELDEPLPVEWLPAGNEEPDDPRNSVTLRHVLHMSSGLYPMDNDYNWVRGSHMVYFGGWDAGYHSRDRGLVHEPGTVFDYENYDPLLALLSLRNAIGDTQDYLEFPHQVLFRKIGMRNTLPGVDRFGNYVMSSQVYTNTRDLARFGLLYLNEGRWNGEQIVSEEWVDFVRTPAPSTWETGNQYGGQFWLVPDERADLPQDAYATRGAQGQFTIIVPSYDLVVVRRGLDWREGSPGPGLSAWNLLEEVLKALPSRGSGKKMSLREETTRR